MIELFEISRLLNFVIFWEFNVAIPFNWYFFYIKIFTKLSLYVFSSKNIPKFNAFWMIFELERFEITMLQNLLGDFKNNRYFNIFPIFLVNKFLSFQVWIMICNHSIQFNFRSWIFSNSIRPTAPLRDTRFSLKKVLLYFCIKQSRLRSWSSPLTRSYKKKNYKTTALNSFGQENNWSQMKL